VLTRDPDGNERCVACNLCAAACPVDCISLQSAENEDGRRYPNFSGSTFHDAFIVECAEEACPTYAIQLIPDFELANTTGRIWCTKRSIF